MRITLLTDFGTADGYVAALKGAIAEIAPSVIVDDAAHDIRPADILGAAFALRRYWRRYPEGTVHVVVIDPGVGSSRRAIAVQADGRFLVGPDNGVFSFVLEDAASTDIVELQAPPDSSATFHGRDVFAPVAARLATGAALTALGASISDPVKLSLPPVVTTEASVLGEIVHVDRFGNLISNIPGQLLRAKATIADRELRSVRTYADAAVDELVVLVNSDGMVEVAARENKAARLLDVERGAPLILSD